MNSHPNERAAIFGLETEYAILYVPDDPGDPEKPPFPLIQKTLFSILQEERKTALSAGIKGGYFLQNGGLIHLETYLRHQGDTPILEAATPECRSPWDLLVYSRAFDKLLTDISRKSAVDLLEHGFRGHIAFGKNNVDSRGVGFGSHENYLVYLRPTVAAKVFFFLCMPAVLVCLIPAFAIVLVALLVVSVFLVLGRLSPSLRALGRKIHEQLKQQETLLQNLLSTYYVSANVLLYPAISLYRNLLKLTVFKAFTKDLTSLLVTRQILTGSGHLNFDEQVFEMSQRAELTSNLSTVIMFSKAKTIFDLKGLLYDPLSFFKRTKKLSITLGDSNLTDLPTFLKIGMAILIIEMIEKGETFRELRLKKPIRAFRQVSLEGPWKNLELAHSITKSAIEIQREYLSRAKVFFARQPEGRIQYRKILDLWEENLGRLAEGPHSMASRADWTAKKSLLDAAVLSQTDWKAFFAWVHVFHRAGVRATVDAESLDDLVREAPFFRRRRLKKAIHRLQLPPEDLEMQRILYFQARKIDLRYHELSHPGGYQRTLESEGLVERLTTQEQVDRASREPPPDTRARIRGYYIRLSPTPESIMASWNDIELNKPSRHIPTPNPFYHRLPGDKKS